MGKLKKFDYIIGIIDQYDSVESVHIPFDRGNSDDQNKMHGDLFPPSMRKWRCKIDNYYSGELMKDFSGNFGVNLTKEDYFLINDHLLNKYGLE